MDGSVWDVQRALIVGRQAATRLSIAQSRERDRAWCERELGDVPVSVARGSLSMTVLQFSDGSRIETCLPGMRP